MTTELSEKKKSLEELLRTMGSAAVAFSAGVDSTFLLKTAAEVLGDRVLAVTIRSCFCPERETAEAAAFCAREGIRHITADVAVLEIPGVAANPPDRCYLCKKALFSRIFQIARENGIAHVLEGSNMDDLGDYRPGMAAVKELGAESPLRAAGLYKAEIRALSREMGLPTWDKPSYACLASRFVYGETITEEKLAMVERAEDYLASLGFRQLRVRLHGDLGRIELPAEDMDRLFREGLAPAVDEKLRALGFRYVSLDLRGYRTGSMNDALSG